MKRSTYCYWLTLAVLLLVGLAGRAHAQGTFNLRVVNMLDAATSIDVHFNDMAQATIADIPVASTSALAQKLPVGAGTIKMAVTPTGAGVGSALINQNITVASGMEYSAVVYGASPSVKLKMLERQLAKLPGPGKALVRVVNLTTLNNPLALDFYLDSAAGTPLFSNVVREGASNFVDVAGSPKSLYITGPGTSNVFTQVIVPFTIGGRLTLFVTGATTSELKVYALSGENTEQHLLPILQGVKGGTLPSIRVMDVWRQRNLSGTGIQALDVFFDDVSTPRFADLKYRVASAKFGPLTQDSITVKFAPVNEGIGSAIYTEEIKLERDSDYVVILTKTSEGAAAALTLSAPNTLPINLPDSFRIRAAHVNDFRENITLKVISNDSPGDTVTIPGLAFLTASEWFSIPRGAFRIEAFAGEQTTPFYTTDHHGSFATTYLTFVVMGDDSSFQIDVLNELLPVMQVFDPAASAPVVIAGESSFKLHNIPNPCVEETSIRFNLPQGEHVNLSLFDPLGRHVMTILDERRGAGEHDVMMKASDLPAGSYIYRLRTERGMQGVGRMVVVR